MNKSVVVSLSICLATLCSAFSFAQSTENSSEKIGWYDLKFQDSKFATALDLLPSLHLNAEKGYYEYVFRAEIDEQVTIQSVVLADVKSSSISNSYFDAHELTALPSQFQIRWEEIQVTKGKRIFNIFVSAFKKNAANSERLLAFSYSLETGNYRSQSEKIVEIPSYADASVLKEGDIYKIAITKDGIYKIDKSFLESMGIAVSSLNPQTINVYGNGGSLLNEQNWRYRPDDLIKNAILVQGEADGNFGSNDYILFYGKGPDKWTQEKELALGRKSWQHTKHYYSDTAYYFIKINDTDPLRISTETNVNTPTHTSTRFQDYSYIESDLYNLTDSGREFYGDAFDQVLTANYTFNFPNVSAVPASVEVNCVGRTFSTSSSFTATVQGNSGNVSIGSVVDSPTSQVARTGKILVNFTPNNANCNVSLTFTKGNSEAKGYLDYILVNVSRDLVMSGSQMRFRDTTTVGFGNITEYQLSSAAAVNELWDITNVTRPVRQVLTANGTIKSFVSSSSTLKEFIAFSGGYFTPVAMGKVENQNIHGWKTVDLVIITSPELKTVADEIAEIHRGEGQLVNVATPEQVFNEFSSGNPDPIAFRQLIKMLYDRALGGDRAPKNLLLVGDGDFSRTKGLANQRGANVLVFESDNSLSPVSSYVSDDYFVTVSPLEDGTSLGLLDCGVGRIPADDIGEAASYLEKIKAYLSQNTSSTGDAYCVGDVQENAFGNWRNVVGFVSDDQDGNGGPYEQIHLISADSLANIMRVRHPDYDLAKMYMDAYTQESTPGGERYPDGSSSIEQRIQNGALLMTYIGHGGERGWAHERILDLPTIEGFTNKYRMPVFLTATCELARYDEPSVRSAGERLVMNPNGGAIAMLTTTRIVFSGENFEMDLAFYANAFEKRNNQPYTLGELNMLTKNGVPPSNDSKPNFSLLGDPALKMVYPKLKVETTHINNTAIASFVDTLKALQEVEFKGVVRNADGSLASNFNGYIYPTVFDKESKVYTQNNDGGVVQDFKSYNKIIYRGKSSVTNGEFSFKFIVPFDINYSVDTARVSYYAVAGNRDGNGHYSKFKIGSVNPNAAFNEVGPAIQVFLNDSTFVNGSTTNTTPIIIAKLMDDDGINTVGNGVGHNLTAILDGNTNKPIVLNEYYSADLNTYKSGVVRYPLPALSIGSHTLKLKAWDVQNNSSEEEIQFTVAEDSQVALSHVLNYPNPFTTATRFMYDHNQACKNLDIRIQIFTIGGKLVKTLEHSYYATGFKGEDIFWDGRDDFGDQIGKGVYVYKIEIRNEQGQKGEQYEKLVILR